MCWIYSTCTKDKEANNFLLRQYLGLEDLKQSFIYIYIEREREIGRERCLHQRDITHSAQAVKSVTGIAVVPWLSEMDPAARAK